jgi:hypothetical protein
MSWQSHTVAVWRRYDNRNRDYRWIASAPHGEIFGWEKILAAQARDGWELVAACVDAYQEGNTSTEATGYRLFFKKPL